MMPLQAWELAKARQAEFAGQSRPILTESYVSKLLEEVASLEQKAIDKLAKLPPETKVGEKPVGEDRVFFEVAKKAVLEAKAFEDDARKKLAEALELARLVHDWREQLQQAQARLVKAREELARLEKVTGRP